MIKHWVDLIHEWRFSERGQDNLPIHADPQTDVLLHAADSIDREAFKLLEEADGLVARGERMKAKANVLYVQRDHILSAIKPPFPGELP